MFDDADDFMPENQRFAEGEGAHGAVSVVVQVRSADTAVSGPHQDLPRFGRCLHDIVDSEISSAVDHESLHDGPSD
jgi:hypothetical protein